MIRRLQLLEPEKRRFRRAAALGGRIREVLLHDNKVIPGILGVLALLVFAWFLAGALMGSGPPNEEGQQASSQASLAQTPEEDQGGGSPAVPEAENRDVDSFAAFTPKDPFRRLLSPASKEGAGGSTRPTTAGGASKSGSSQKAGTNAGGSQKAGGGAGAKASPGGGGNTSGGGAKGSPSGGGAKSSPPGGAGGGVSGGAGGSTSGGAGGSTPGGAGGSILGEGGGAGQGGNGGLFNSGGDLPLP